MKLYNKLTLLFIITLILISHVKADVECETRPDCDLKYGEGIKICVDNHCLSPEEIVNNYQEINKKYPNTVILLSDGTYKLPDGSIYNPVDTTRSFDIQPISELNDCDNIKLSLVNICYDTNTKQLNLILKNDGSVSISMIGLYKGYMDGSSDGRNFWDFTDFRNGRTITIIDENIGTVVSGYEYEGGINFVSGLNIVPSLSDGSKCISHQIQVEKIINCKTNNQVWPKTDSNSQSNLTNSNYLTYIIIFIILICVLLLIKYKLYKKLKFSHKKVEKIEIHNEEIPSKKSKISSDISEAISIKNLTVKHGKNLILDNVDLSINKEELVCLLGPSGTGKSTIIESLVGRRIITKGIIRIFGKDIKNKETFNHIGFVPQSHEVYMNQTVEQNILSSMTKYGIKENKRLIEEVLNTIGLSHRKEVKANKLSGGQLKLLSLGMELIKDSELLILDEPTTGLDPNTRNSIITILSKLVTKQNKTVFFTTHFMDDAEECDEVIILNERNIAVQGPPSKIKKRLPGNGKIVNVILDNVTDDLLKNIKKIEGVEKIISEGRNIKIITEEPNAIKIAQKINEIGGIVNKTELIEATMKEVFVFYTGKELEE
ncbi:MAG: ABC transporter ATP-binding protein [Candidatus Nanoarchaeia archaeon]